MRKEVLSFGLLEFNLYLIKSEGLNGKDVYIVSKSLLTERTMFYGLQYYLSLIY